MNVPDNNPCPPGADIANATGPAAAASAVAGTASNAPAPASAQRQRTWRPPPPQIPTAWIARPAERRGRVARQLVATIVRNLVPVAGYLKFGWPAQECVLLGAWNFALLVTFLAASECAMPRLLAADAGQLGRATLRWALLAAGLTWVVVIGTAIMMRVPMFAQIGHAGSGSIDAGFVLTALAVTVVSIVAYRRELHDWARSLRAWVPKVHLKPRSGAQICGLLAIAALLEIQALSLMLRGLAGNEIDEAYALFVVVAVSLFLDGCRVIAPDEYFARRTPGAVAGSAERR